MGENSGVAGKMAVPEDFFKDVKFYVIGNVDPKAPELLLAGGAKEDHYLSEMVTHAIADSDQEDEVNEAKELFELPVVTSQWVILSIKCGILLPMNAFKPDPKRIFSGVVACPSQVSKEDQKNIWALLTVHGGKCQAEFNRNVTHLITTNTAGAKFDIATRHSDKVFIVTPDWVTESVSKGAQEDAKRYHPRLLVFDIPEKKKPPPKEIIQPQSPGKSITPPAIGPPSLLNPSLNTPPRTESSRTKEALAKIINNRQRQSFAPMPDFGHPPPPGMVMFPNVGPPLSPRAMMPPGMRASSPRNMLRNITNEGKTPKSPKSPRSPGRAKISQLVSSLNRPPRQMSPSRYSNISNQLNLNRPMQPDVAVCYGHDPNEIVPADLCLIGCVFYITDYQKLITSDQMATWKKVIEQHGGYLDESYSNRVTHVLCVHQKSDVFQLALRDGKRLVTAHWLNDCLLTKKMAPPWLALHFPSCYAKEKPACNQRKTGLEYPWHSMRQNISNDVLNANIKKEYDSIPIIPEIICVTNFEGIDRERVKSMIGCVGAKYTGYLTRANSVVVCKKLSGPKFDKATEWRIPCVNAQWLSDLMLGDLCALKLPIPAKYLNFIMDEPFKIDPWKVCHLLEGWKSPIKISKETWKKFHPNPMLKGINQSQSSQPQPSASHTRGTPTPAATHSGVHATPVTPGQAPAAPGTSAEKAPSGEPQQAAGLSAHGELGAGLTEAGKLAGVKENGEGTPGTASHDAAAMKEVVTNQPGADGAPVRGNGDGSAAPAAGIQGAKRKERDGEEDSAEKKPKLDIPDPPVENHESSDASDKENCPAAPPVVLITGFTKGRSRQLMSEVTRLGGRIVTTAAGATHLVANSISRTVKFLTALSGVKYAVTPEWVDKSGQEGKLLAEDGFALSDDTTERAFNFKLSESLQRASKSKLFKELTFYMTPGIYPSTTLLKDIIQSASGTVVDKRPSPKAIASRLNNQGQQTFVVLACQNDIHLCKDLIERRIPVHNAEFVLTGVMRQEVDFHCYQLH